MQDKSVEKLKACVYTLQNQSNKSIVKRTKTKSNRVKNR